MPSCPCSVPSRCPPHPASPELHLTRRSRCRCLPGDPAPCTGLRIQPAAPAEHPAQEQDGLLQPAVRGPGERCGSHGTPAEAGVFGVPTPRCHRLPGWSRAIPRGGHCRFLDGLLSLCTARPSLRCPKPLQIAGTGARQRTSCSRTSRHRLPWCRGLLGWLRRTG